MYYLVLTDEGFEKKNSEIERADIETAKTVIKKMVNQNNITTAEPIECKGSYLTC